MLDKTELEQAKVLWEKYFNLTQELLKFINKQDMTNSVLGNQSVAFNRTY